MEPIANKPDLAACARVVAIQNGTATRQQIRKHCVVVMRAVIQDAVNEWIELDEDCDERGRYRYVSDTQLEVVLEDEAARGFCIENPATLKDKVDGGDFQVYGWEATVKRWKRKGRTIAVCLDVRGCE